MDQVNMFTQPDQSADPRYFIDFLDMVDRIPKTSEIRARSYQMMRLTLGAAVLDIGCGVGTAVSELAEIVGANGNARGIDISRAMAAEAASRYADRANIRFATGDAHALPYTNEAFDATRMERVLLFLPDRGNAVREMMRVTRRGGRVVVTDVDFVSGATAGSDRELTSKMMSLIANSCAHPTSGRDLPAVFSKAGLEDVTVDLFAVSTPYQFCLHLAREPLTAAVAAGKATQGDVERWLEGLADLEASKTFLQMWFFVVVGGTVP